MTRAVSAALALGCAVACACDDTSLDIDMLLPPGVDADELALRVQVYALQSETACDALAFGDVTEASLASSLVLTQVLTDGTTLEDIPRAGDKLVVVRGTARREDKGDVAVGCAPLGEISGRTLVTVELEHTVHVAAGPNTPNQLVVPGDPLLSGFDVIVTRAIDDLITEGRTLRVDVAGDGGLLSSGPDGVARVDPAPLDKGPFEVVVVGRWSVDAPLVVPGISRPTSKPLALGDRVTQALAVRFSDGVVGVASVHEEPRAIVFAHPAAAPGGGLEVTETTTLLTRGAQLVARMAIPGAAPAAGPGVLALEAVDPAAELFALAFFASDGGAPIDLGAPPRSLTGAAADAIVALGPCAFDEDAAPLFVVTGNDGRDVVAALIDADGARDATVSQQRTPIASLCVAGRRAVVVRERAGGVAVVDAEDASFVAGVDLDDAPALAGLDDGLAYGADAATGGVVRTVVEGIALSIERRDGDGALTWSHPIAASPFLVGAARLFAADDITAYGVVAIDQAAAAAQLFVANEQGAGVLPLDECRPAQTCEVLPVDVNDDGVHELLVVHELATGDADQPSATVFAFTRE